MVRTVSKSFSRGSRSLWGEERKLPSLCGGSLFSGSAPAVTPHNRPHAFLSDTFAEDSRTEDHILVSECTKYHERCHCWAEVPAIMLRVCGAGEATQSSLLGRTNWATSNLGFFKAKAWESKLGQWCWWSPIILRLRRWGQEDQEFKVVLVFK